MEGVEGVEGMEGMEGLRDAAPIPARKAVPVPRVHLAAVHVGKKNRLVNTVTFVPYCSSTETSNKADGLVGIGLERGGKGLIA